LRKQERYITACQELKSVWYCSASIIEEPASIIKRSAGESSGPLRSAAWVRIRGRDEDRFVNRRLGVLGVPTSAGAFAPGQEKGPRALRDAGLVESLRACGIDVRDHGDREIWRWRPDRERPRAQNLAKVVEIVQDTARRVADSVGQREVTLVLGGDCTVGIGTVAGHLNAGERVGLVYFDAHADLNVPDSVREGALDWMGVAHMLDEHGANAELVNVGSRVPLLDPDRVLLFGWGPEQATDFEREAIERRAISVVPVDAVAEDPEGAAARGLGLIESRCDRLLVHFDVDVIDFTDAPLSENPGRNEGLSYDHALRALDILLGSPRLAGVTITELNPDHAEEGAHSIERLAHCVADRLGRSLGR
jgi:arginase